jgi:hemerythrin superfamily protein
MPRTNQTSQKDSRRRTKNGSPKDAIALLKADHRQVEEWFSEFEKARDGKRKWTLAKQICTAFKVHAQIEEEIFYPAFLEATEDEDMHHEAEVEHTGAKRLIADIESRTSDEYFDARVTVLSEMIKHHVQEEERPDGMFAKARRSELDLEEIGEQLQARKSELEGDSALLGKTKRLFASA